MRGDGTIYELGEVPPGVTRAQATAGWLSTLCRRFNDRVALSRPYGALQGDDMKGLFTSRKFIVAVISLSAMVLGTVSGMDVTPDQVEVMVQLVCAWLIAQGIADNGAGGTTRSGE